MVANFFEFKIVSWIQIDVQPIDLGYFFERFCGPLDGKKSLSP
jgi:hypothetical protein